jgi:hypothetical protein
MNEEYARLYTDRLTAVEADRGIGYVVSIFEAQWQRETPPLPIFLSLLTQGTMALQFLYGLGKDIETV